MKIYTFTDGYGSIEIEAANYEDALAGLVGLVGGENEAAAFIFQSAN